MQNLLSFQRPFKCLKSIHQLWRYMNLRKRHFFLLAFKDEHLKQEKGCLLIVPRIPGQLTDPGVNFASVHGLTAVTVHMSFWLPRGNFGRRVTRCTTQGNPPCRGNFSPCEQNAKVAHAHY